MLLNCYGPTPSFIKYIVASTHLVVHCDLVLVFSCFRVAIEYLVVTTSMCPATPIEILWYWLVRLALARFGGGSRRSDVIIFTNFTTVGGEDLHELLLLGKNLLNNFCGSCCSGGPRYSGGTLFAIFSWC